MPRLPTRPLALVAALVAVHAAATPASAQGVEVVPIPYADAIDPGLEYEVPPGGQNGPGTYDPPPVDPPLSPLEQAFRDEPGIYLLNGFFVDQVDPGHMRLAFRDPEIAALAGTRLTRSQARGTRSALAGGMTFGYAYRPTPWLRFPEARFSLGGGDVRGAASSLEGAPGFQVRPSHTFVSRFDLGIGVQAPLGQVTPYAVLRGGRSRYALTVDVSHDDLGKLGSERIAGGQWEAGVEAGVEAHIGERVRLAAAYRRGLVGAAGHGGMLTLVIEGE